MPKRIRKNKTKNPKHGKCRICGTVGPLSFEHVPPEKAFNQPRGPQNNSWRKLQIDFDKLFQKDSPEFSGRVKNNQRGSGEFTLCKSCNSKTGSWYASSYVEHAHSAMEFLLENYREGYLEYKAELRPLAILKQIITMMFSISQDLGPEKDLLKKFIEDPESKNFPSGYKVFQGFYLSQYARKGGPHMTLNVESGTSTYFVEGSHPPLGYLLLFGGCEPPDPRLEDITCFSEYGYSERVKLSFTTPCLSHPLDPMGLIAPGHYKTWEETQEGEAA